MDVHRDVVIIIRKGKQRSETQNIGKRRKQECGALPLCIVHVPRSIVTIIMLPLLWIRGGGDNRGRTLVSSGGSSSSDTLRSKKLGIMLQSNENHKGFISPNRSSRNKNLFDHRLTYWILILQVVAAIASLGYGVDAKQSGELLIKCCFHLESRKY